MPKHRKLKTKSSFQQHLESHRVVVHPYLMLRHYGNRIEPEVIGLFMRLLPYALGAVSATDTMILSRFAGVHVKTFRKWWPRIKEAFFVVGDDGLLRLADIPWLRVQTLPTDRQNLTHLLDALLAHWGNACVYCGADNGQLQIEHIVPISRGGTNDVTNLTLACQPCNLKKHTQTAAEFGHPHIHDMAARIQ